VKIFVYSGREVKLTAPQVACSQIFMEMYVVRMGITTELQVMSVLG
jgi:hypothetical protein